MGIIDYSLEPKSDIAFVDMKSFYASVECVKRNLNPLTTSLCVMSNSDNASGLTLASSPTFKRVFGKKNVGRARDLPFDIQTRKFSFENAKNQKLDITKEYIDYVERWAEKTLIVPPRMSLYIEENLKIQKVFQNYAPKDEIHPYSIDESFLDLTGSLNYFVPNRNMTKKDKLDCVSAKIQNEIWKETGIYSTVGMSNANPLLAKLALDNEAKTTRQMRANWSYEDVEAKVWNIKNLTDFWGIGSRTAARLNKLGIYSIRDLANYNVDILKKEFGVIGVQLWFHANGVDESKVNVPYIARSKSYGNSQVLPRDYHSQSEIEIVLREMAEQVATRIRKKNKKTGRISIYIGFSYKEDIKSIKAQRSINPTNSTKALSNEVIRLFRERYRGGAVRNIGVTYGKLVDDSFFNYTLLDDVRELQKQEILDKTFDEIRDKFGYTSVLPGFSLMKGSRVIERSKLIGGHAGGMDGIIWL